MASLAFEVHVDKENDTPVAVFTKSGGGGGLKAIGPQSKRFAQPTPRKALNDVNNFAVPLKKPGLKIAKGFENQIKKPEPEMKKKKTQKLKDVQVDKKPPKTVVTNVTVTKKQPSPVVVHQPSLPDDEEYDSDSIFPRSQRLSTYVGKVFSWRPPCLFGAAILNSDEESDISDEENFQDDLIEWPARSEFPDHDDLLPCPDIDDLPPPMTDDDLDALLQAHSSATASAQSQPQCLDAPLLPSQEVESAPLSKSPSPVPSDTDLCLLQTPDTSLSLGSLHVMTSHDIV